MKYIILLIVLMVVSFAVTRQMDASPQTQTVGTDVQNQAASAPGVPGRPQDLQQFATDMDKFVQDSGEQRRQQIDQQSR